MVQFSNEVISIQLLAVFGSPTVVIKWWEMVVIIKGETKALKSDSHLNKLLEMALAFYLHSI